MKLKLVKHGKFLGTVCDFYVDEENNIYMSRTQIGYALEYKNPSKGIENVHNRNHKRMDRFSIKITGAQIEGGSKHIDPSSEMYMYIERGIYEICRKSAQPVADDFNDWVYETIQSIKKNGYYIATEKDDKWLGIREESKQARKYETDQIKLFIEYAKEQGSRNADRYYMIFTKLIHGRVGIQSGQRGNVSQETLMELKALEMLVKMRIRKLMESRMPYKEIYQDVKKMVEEF
jgi:prophage antirepressor-like protein